MKNEKINLLFQIVSVSAFFALFYIFKAELYYYAVKTAHTEFADL